MADQITDSRTLIHAADAVTPYVDLAGGAVGTLDTEIFVEGTGSVGQYLTSSLDGLLFNAGSAQDWSNNVFYIRINCGIVGLLDTKANGGFRIRFCGATVTNFFEVYVGGQDSWPTAIAGGWATFVVDIEDARSTAVTNGWTGGTAPATTAIQYVGWAGVTAGTMPRMVDNTWMDASYRLPDGAAGIQIEGRNGGTTDWSFSDIFAQLGNAAGVFLPAGAGGAWVCNTPIQIGVNDGTTHAFSDLNETLLWQDQEYAPADLYGITVVGATTGTVNVTLGQKTGTGDAARGSQGISISSDAAGVRWFFAADGADIDAVNLYGCTFLNGSTFSIGGTHVETISCQFLDCSLATVTNSLFQSNTIVNANTADGVAFVQTDDVSDIRFCSFTHSDGHAIEITTPLDTAQESRGNTFSGYSGTAGSNLTPSSGSTDAAVYNNAAGDVTLSVTSNGDTPSVRNGASATTTIPAAVVTVRVTVRDANTTNAVQNARVLLAASDGTGPLPFEDTVSLTFSAGTVTVSHTSHGLSTGDYVIITGATEVDYLGLHQITVTGTNAYTYTIAGTPASPATGLPVSTGVVLTGTTDASGVIEDTGYEYTSDQPVTGKARKSTTPPLYKTGPVSGTITSTGFSATAFLVPDE